MKLSRAILSFLLPLSLGLATACDSAEEALESSNFLVTEPSADGTVLVVARTGTVLPESQVSLSNVARGLATSGFGLSDGSMFASLVGSLEDAFEIRYTAADGTTTSEEVAPIEGVTSVHGLLTLSDPDGEEGEQPGCMILIRDDIEGEGAELEVLLVPPKGGKPPKDGQQPPKDGQQPPPPADGEQASGGQQPPKDGGKPPCQPPVPLPEYVDQYITVVGRWVEPKEDVPCDGKPFAPEAVVADDAVETETP